MQFLTIGSLSLNTLEIYEYGLESTMAVDHKPIQVEGHQWLGTVIPTVIFQAGLGRGGKEKEHTQKPNYV